MLEHFIDNSVGWIVFNRPESHNAISLKMWQEIPKAVEELIAQQSSLIVFTGKQGAFTSGADLSELQQIKSYDQSRQYWLAIKDALLSIKSCTVPTIAKIDGACLGGGCLIASACDLRFATGNSIFGIPVARLGILLDEESIRLLVNLIGFSNAKQLLYTGQPISASTAYSMGLINAVVDKSELDNYVGEQIRQIGKNVPNALSHTKMLMNNMIENQTTYNETEQVSVINSYLLPEFQKRISSFRQD